MSKIAIGTVKFGTDYGISPMARQVQPKEVKSILNYAHSQGIDVLDTAPVYGNSESVLGSSGVDCFKVVTKTRHFDGADINNVDAELVRKDFFKSLTDLKRSNVYGVLVHNAYDLLKPGSEKIFNQLNHLKQEGKLNKLGVSVYDSSQLESILANFKIDLVQLPFNILDKRLIDNNTLQTLQEKGIEVHARSVFLQGLLLMDKEDISHKFKRWDALWKVWFDWLHDNKITALEATIKYVVTRPEISKTVVGVDTVGQLKEIIVASHGKMPDIPSELFMTDVDLLNPSNWSKL